jgi:hypothetical protein
MYFAFSAQSVQSIMGATENRCANMLTLFRIIILSGIADFWADRNFNPTVETFSFHFKYLSGSPDRFRTLRRLAWYGIAVLDELVQYRSGLYPRPSIYFGRKVTCCPPRA